MAERFKEGHAYQAEPKPFFDEDAISRFDILNLFGRQRLESIQQVIAKATGLAIVTLDYKGQPLTEMTGFSSFCRQMRQDEKQQLLCRSSDIYGASQALANQGQFIYFCPCGLLEVAIPIIVKDHYLGCFFGGQAKCEKAPEEIPRLEKLFENQLNSCKLNAVQKKLLKKNQSYDFNHFTAMADMMALIIKQISENELAGQAMAKDLKGDFTSLEEYAKSLEAQLNLKKSEMVELKSRLNYYFLINSLNSISNLAVIENSPRTNEMILLFAEHLRHGLPADKDFVFLAEEIDRIERYLKMQKIRFGDMLNYSLNLSQNVAMHQVPVHVIMPFVERAVFYGLATHESPLTVTISIALEERHIRVVVADDGPGLSEEELLMNFAEFQNGYEGEAIQMGVAGAKQRLSDLFGHEYVVEIRAMADRSTESIIRFPAVMPTGAL